jgi:hypothetical protein
VLREIFGAKRDEGQGAGKNCIKLSFLIRIKHVAVEE